MAVGKTFRGLYKLVSSIFMLIAIIVMSATIGFIAWVVLSLVKLIKPVLPYLKSP